jgi:hypothetical protein
MVVPALLLALRVNVARTTSAHRVQRRICVFSSVATWQGQSSEISMTHILVVFGCSLQVLPKSKKTRAYCRTGLHDSIAIVCCCINFYVALSYSRHRTSPNARNRCRMARDSGAPPEPLLADDLPLLSQTLFLASAVTPEALHPPSPRRRLWHRSTSTRPFGSQTTN